MARPSYSTALDTILAAGNANRAVRILTCDLAWPSGDPPFAAGDAVSLPAVGTPAVYAAATFNAAVWTDVSALVEDWRVTSDAAMVCDALSLAVPVSWASTVLAQVFREMRAIRVQERWRHGSTDTGWFDVGLFLSDGYGEQWEEGRHRYVVNGRDVLKLANLDPLASTSRAQVYQPDLVPHGTLATPYDMPMVSDDADAWEFAVTDDGTASGAIQPNWADRPGPQFWCHNVPGSAVPVKLAVAGTAIQAVFGEGVVRLGKAYAQAAPGSPADYTKGLGFSGATVPDVRCVLSRYAHPATEDRDGTAIASDISAGKEQLASPAVAGQVTLAGDLTGLPAGLSLLAKDGTCRRWATTALTLSGGNTIVTLAASSESIATGTALQYGDANRAVDVIEDLLLRAGYQQADSTAPLYLSTPETPQIRVSGSLVETDLTLPPLAYQDTDGVTPLEAIEALRRDGYLPPNYAPRASASGQVSVVNVAQLSAGHADIIPLASGATAAVIDRSDVGAYTRVVARGLARQVTDLSRQSGVSIADVAAVDGGLPTPAHTLEAEAVRSGATGSDYVFTLADLLVDRAAGSTLLPATTPMPVGGSNGPNAVIARRLATILLQYATTARFAANTGLRPWAWYYHATATADVDALVAQWQGAALADITLSASAVLVDGLELDVSNPWHEAMRIGNGGGMLEATGWGDLTGVTRTRSPLTTARPARCVPQVLAVQYWDADNAQWRSLVSYIPCAPSYPEVIRLESADFDTRGPVSTTKLRLLCQEPTLVEQGSYDEAWYHAIIGVWLSRVKVFGSPEVRGTAALGETSPFDTAGWQAIRARMRRRTWVMDSAPPWCNTDARADGLALEWLYQYTRDLAPRRIRAVRPDVRQGDTVSLTLPNGTAEEYLVTAADHGQAAEAGIIGTDWTAPHYETDVAPDPYSVTFAATAGMLTDLTFGVTWSNGVAGTYAFQELYQWSGGAWVLRDSNEAAGDAGSISIHYGFAGSTLWKVAFYLHAAPAWGSSRPPGAVSTYDAEHEVTA